MRHTSAGSESRTSVRVSRRRLHVAFGDAGELFGIEFIFPSSFFCWTGPLLAPGWLPIAKRSAVENARPCSLNFGVESKVWDFHHSEKLRLNRFFDAEFPRANPNSVDGSSGKVRGWDFLPANEIVRLLNLVTTAGQPVRYGQIHSDITERRWWKGRADLSIWFETDP